MILNERLPKFDPSSNELMPNLSHSHNRFTLVSIVTHAPKTLLAITISVNVMDVQVRKSNSACKTTLLDSTLYKT